MSSKKTILVVLFATMAFIQGVDAKSIDQNSIAHSGGGSHHEGGNHHNKHNQRNDHNHHNVNHHDDHHRWHNDRYREGAGRGVYNPEFVEPEAVELPINTDDVIQEPAVPPTNVEVNVPPGTTTE